VAEKYNSFKNKIVQMLLNQKFIFLFFCVVTLIASIQKYYIGDILVYLIYKNAALNMLALKNIYQVVPGLDLFLYSPTFAFLIIPLTYLPDLVGCILWNLISISLLILSISLLSIKNWQKTAICGIIFFEALISIQNFQANILVAAICLFVFVCLEKKKFFWAALCAGLGLFIKIFGVGFAVLFLFYKRKTRFLIYFLACIIILFVLPLIFSRFDLNYIRNMYTLWPEKIALRQQRIMTINIFGVLETWFNIKFNYKTLYLLQIISLCIIALPLLRFAKYKDYSFKLFYLSSLLIWVVIFNRAAESPTYVIAMTGVGIWFIAQKITPFTIGLLVFAILFTSLSCTDLFPPYVRKHYFTPYGIKALPCIVIWAVLQFQLLLMPFINGLQRKK
jgi:hypothetical protein